MTPPGFAPSALGSGQDRDNGGERMYARVLRGPRSWADRRVDPAARRAVAAACGAAAGVEGLPDTRRPRGEEEHRDHVLRDMEASEAALTRFPRTYPDSLKGRRAALKVYEVGVADQPGSIAASQPPQGA